MAREAELEQRRHGAAVPVRSAISYLTFAPVEAIGVEEAAGEFWVFAGPGFPRGENRTELLELVGGKGFPHHERQNRGLNRDL